MVDKSYTLIGGPFDGRSFPAKGLFFMVPCRSFHADAVNGNDAYIVHTVAVYEMTLTVTRNIGYRFSREEVVDDGYRAP